MQDIQTEEKNLKIDDEQMFSPAELQITGLGTTADNFAKTEKEKVLKQLDLKTMKIDQTASSKNRFYRRSEYLAKYQEVVNFLEEKFIKSGDENAKKYDFKVDRPFIVYEYTEPSQPSIYFSISLSTDELSKVKNSSSETDILRWPMLLKTQITSAMVISNSNTSNTHYYSKVKRTNFWIKIDMGIVENKNCLQTAAIQDEITSKTANIYNIVNENITAQNKKVKEDQKPIPETTKNNTHQPPPKLKEEPTKMKIDEPQRSPLQKPLPTPPSSPQILPTTPRPRFTLRATKKSDDTSTAIADSNSPKKTIIIDEKSDEKKPSTDTIIPIIPASIPRGKLRLGTSKETKPQPKPKSPEIQQPAKRKNETKDDDDERLTKKPKKNQNDMEIENKIPITPRSIPSKSQQQEPKQEEQYDDSMDEHKLVNTFSNLVEALNTTNSNTNILNFLKSDGYDQNDSSSMIIDTIDVFDVSKHLSTKNNDQLKRIIVPKKDYISKAVNLWVKNIVSETLFNNTASVLQISSTFKSLTNEMQSKISNLLPNNPIKTSSSAFPNAYLEYISNIITLPSNQNLSKITITPHTFFACVCSFWNNIYKNGKQPVFIKYSLKSPSASNLSLSPLNESSWSSKDARIWQLGKASEGQKNWLRGINAAEYQLCEMTIDEDVNIHMNSGNTKDCKFFLVSNIIGRQLFEQTIKILNFITTTKYIKIPETIKFKKIEFFSSRPQTKINKELVFDKKSNSSMSSIGQTTESDDLHNFYLWFMTGVNNITSDMLQSPLLSITKEITNEFFDIINAVRSFTNDL
jgi:hypothetical protein